jgi:asparagine synthase (glutamine-hydrolysing)
MCGLSGIIHLDGSPIDSDALRRMTGAIAHRGPDGGETWSHGPVGLGHRRLSILDLTEAASQPMRSQDGRFTLVFNGEIYNFQEKRTMLEAKGCRFTSTGDTEVLLKLYEEFGERCVDHLRGMFVFAIHDAKAQKVFIARDRVGKKPLKYFHVGNTLAFASEWKALREHPLCPREMDDEAIHHYLTLMYLPSPLTGIQGVQKLPAAHGMMIDLTKKSVEIKRYWELKYDPDEKTTEGEWSEKILSTFDESVRLRMIADVPVGAFLSAGVDSAAVVAFMAKHSAQPVKTFTIGSADPKYNELPGAQLIAERFKTDHHPIVLEPDIVRLLPELVRFYEEPYADVSSIPTYLVSRETRKHVTVALNGDGGDENFAGYVRYRILRFSEFWSRFPGPVHGLARMGADAFHALRRDTLSYRARRFERTMNLPWEKRYLQYLSFFTDDEKRSLYASGFGANFEPTDAWYARRTEEARGRAQDRIHQAMAMDLETYLAEDLLPKVDLGSMAHGLEARSPFLDHELLELTARIPARHKIHGNTGKWILKHALKDTLPAETLWKKKTGFRLPLNRWFRSELKPFVRERLLGASPEFYRIMDRSALERFLKEYEDSSIDYSDHLWALLWLAEWIEQYTGD